MHARMKNRGFTLIELLVVIAIIGLLSSVVLASLNSAREKAKIARTLQDFREIEKALYLWADDENRTTWWTSAEHGQSPPSIKNFVENTGLGEFLPAAPAQQFAGSSAYVYGNSGETFVCNSSPAHYGVHIYLQNVDASLFQALDDLVDNGDGNRCGKIIAQASNTTVMYKISYDGSF